MPRMERNTRAACRLITLLVAVLATVDARGQTAGSAPLLVIRGPENAEEVAVQREAAEGIIAETELAMGRHFEPSHRARLVDRLTWGRAGSLASRPGGGGTSTLGDTGSDLVYTPVTPCRVFDTRVSGGALDPEVPRSFLVAGTERFEGQGGNAGGCGVPLGPATAVVLNLVAVAPSGNGNLRAWAANDPAPAPPLATVLNFAKVPGLYALANGLDLPICDPAAVDASCSSDLLLKASGSSTHVVGDVLGYFRKADLESALLVGVSDFGPVPATDGTLHLGWTIVTTPSRLVECAVTCSITIKSDAPNSSGHAYVQSGASAVDFTASVRGGSAMYVAPVASPGASSATTAAQIGLGGPYRFKFACYVSAAGDFLGDELTGAVSWVCR